MRITSPQPKSSFLSMEKDLNIIVNKILNNERLKKLLFYNSPDALYRDDLTEEQTLQLIDQNILTVPKLKIDKDVLTYIIVSFDNFTPSGNPQFRDNTVMIDIICHFDQWKLKDMELRPYKIAGEIDSMFDNARFSGIGLLQFMGSNQIVLNSEFGGVCLCYQATHGEEDKKYMQTPEQEDQFLEDFEKMVVNNNGH